MHSAWRLLSRWISNAIQAIWAPILVTVLISTLALAHGDDDVTAASFIGPMLAFVTVVTVVGLGRLLLRALFKRG